MNQTIIQILTSRYLIQYLILRKGWIIWRHRVVSVWPIPAVVEHTAGTRIKTLAAGCVINNNALGWCYGSWPQYLILYCYCWMLNGCWVIKGCLVVQLTLLCSHRSRSRGGIFGDCWVGAVIVAIVDIVYVIITHSVNVIIAIVIVIVVGITVCCCFRWAPVSEVSGSNAVGRRGRPHNWVRVYRGWSGVEGE